MKLTKKLLVKAVTVGLDRVERHQLRQRASDWTYCAIGENRSNLKNKGFVFADSAKHDLPQTELIIKKGCRFSALVAKSDYVRAGKIYDFIQDLAS